MAPLLTKQVLDKLLEAATAAAAAKLLQQQQQQQQNSPSTHSSLPDLSKPTESDDNQRGSITDDEDEDLPADTSSPIGDGNVPKKSNLMSGRSKNGGSDSRQLSVRFDPNQVFKKTKKIIKTNKDDEESVMLFSFL